MKHSVAKKKFAILLIMFLGGYFFHATHVFAQIDYESYSGFTVDDTPLLPEKEVHPKLWFDESEIESVYNKRNADEYAASLWQSISTSSYLTREFPQAPVCSDDMSFNAVHAYYGDMARIAKYNAFMFIMEGNETHKNRAIEALKRAYDGPIYDCPQIDPLVSSSPVDETYRAMWAQNFAASYDWIQPVLTPDDDAIIRERLAKEAQVLYENIWIRPDGGWGPRPHNHRSKPAWGLGSLALVLSDYSDESKNSPEDWLREALEASNSNLKYFFSSDGIYREGSQYYIYSHINFVPFLYHYKNVSGVDLFEVFKPAFIWEFHVANNNGWMPNIEDSYLRHNFLHMVASQYMDDTDGASPLHESAKWGNLFQWRYFTTNKEPWGGEFGNNTGASNDDTMDLDKYLTYDPSIKPVAPTGSGTKFFLEGGQTIFRNNWNFEDPDSRYLLFHGVAEADNHNQFDHLSFIIHAENQMMASDSGYSRSAYGDQIRRTWYRVPEAHNTVTLNGNWPVDMAQNETPESRYSIDTEFFDFQEKSARFIENTNDTSKGESPLLFPPDSESLGYITRAIAFPDQQYFVVADQLRTRDGSEADFSIYLHGGKGQMSGQGNFRQWIYGADQYGSPAKFAAWFLTDQAQYRDHEGEVSYIKDDYSTHGYVEAAVRGNAVNALQILVPLSITDALPNVRDLSDPDRAGGTVEMDGYLDTYMVQQQYGPLVTVDAMQSDGTFAYVRQNGPVKQFAVREGKLLSYQDKTWFTSSAPVTATFNVSDPEHYTGAISTDQENYEISSYLPFGKQVEKVIFNGMDYPSWSQNGMMVTIHQLDYSGKLEIKLADGSESDAVPPADVADLTVVHVDGNSVQLQWTAPGDDGNIGEADYYDLRYALYPITEENWEEAVQVSGEPVPISAGTVQSMIITGLNTDTTYYFALKSVDKASNISGLSNIVEARTTVVEDTIPPAGIFDLRIQSLSSESVVVSWTAPGDDAYAGKVSAYDVRYSTSPITEENWDQAKRVHDLPSPQPAGEVELLTIDQLLAGRTYFIAIKAMDEAGNISPVSNQIFVVMPDSDDVMKLPVSGVQASGHDGNIPENVIDGSFDTRWSALSEGEIGSRSPQYLTFDLGSVYALHYAKIAYYSGNIRKSFFDLQVSVDGENWFDVLTDVETSGMTSGFESYELSENIARYVRLVGYGNSSSGWNSVTEVEIYGLQAELPEIAVGDVKFFAENGDELTDFPESDRLMIRVPVTNYMQEDQQVTVIAVLYDERQRAENVVVMTSTIRPSETERYIAGITLPEETEGYSIKLFYWNDLDGMQAKHVPLLFPN